MIEEAKADIHVDPLLQRACALDVTKYCVDVPPGAGRSKKEKNFYESCFSNKTNKFVLTRFFFSVLQCLLNVMDSKKNLLRSICKLKLKQRIEMFKYAEKAVSEK